jgi:hypothetical protein
MESNDALAKKDQVVETVIDIFVRVIGFVERKHVSFFIGHFSENTRIFPPIAVKSSHPNLLHIQYAHRLSSPTAL